MRWALRGVGLAMAIINAGFFALAFELAAAWQWAAVFLASLAVLAFFDRSLVRMIDKADADATADTHHV